MKCPNCNHRFHYRQSVIVEHDGVPMSLRELSTATGIAYSTLQNRYRRGNRGDDLVRPAEIKYSSHRVVSNSSMAGEEIHVEPT